MTRTNRLRLLLFALAAVILSGCGTVGLNVGTQPQASQGGSSRASLQAVTQPTATPATPAPTLTSRAGSTPTSTPTSTSAGNQSTWRRKSQATSGGVSYSYSYPPTWTAELVYCPNSTQQMGSHLPPGCASTDFLTGQKAQDVASSLRPAAGKKMTLAGKQAVSEVSTTQKSGQSARVYTVMVYDDSGAPLFGFVTNIGPGTSEAEQQTILATLDGITATLSVEK